MSKQVIKNGVKTLLGNLNELTNGDNIIISGTDIAGIKHVRTYETDRKATRNEQVEGGRVPIMVNHFSFMGRSFTINEDSANQSLAKLLEKQTQ